MRSAEQFFMETTKKVIDAINTDASLKEMQKHAQELVNRVNTVNQKCQERAEFVAKEMWTQELRKWKLES